MNIKILIIDDEDLFREDLALLLKRKGFTCQTAPSAEIGLETIAEFLPDIVLSDIVMPGKSGIELLSDIHLIHPECAVIIMTAFGTMDTAIDAFRKGAVDYLLKPPAMDDLLSKIQRIMQHKKLLEEIKYLRREVAEDVEALSLVGQSASMKQVLQLIKKVAPKNSTVLVSGESGTGKEVVARAIHEFSGNRDEPFIALNCAGFQESLLESELFGHEKGAFTGAMKDKTGFFEAAGEGTLFLDEISEMPMALQGKLLRVLEQREFYRVGGTTAIPVQARIIAATNKNLNKCIEAETFREDLYYRIAVFEITLPPLRERVADIPLLVDYFIRKFNKEMKTKYVGTTPEAIQALMSYNWPGNIRELRNLIERAMILCDSHTITPEGFPPQIIKSETTFSIDTENLKEAVHAFEKNFIQKVLKSCKWNKEAVARRLGVNSSTLYRKMSELGIKDPTAAAK